jgi:hypothetical protein
MEPRRVLIVANQTAAGEHLVRAVRHRMQGDPCRFTLLVPASPPPNTATWTEGEARALANERMEHALRGLRAAGAEIEGVIGDPNPLLAVEDLMRQEAFDEAIVSTLPSGASRWLRQDLPRRIRQEFGIPTKHVVADLEPAAPLP